MFYNNYKDSLRTDKSLATSEIADQDISNNLDSATSDKDEDQMDNEDNRSSLSKNESVVSPIDASAISSSQIQPSNNTADANSTMLSPFNSPNQEIADVDSMTAEKSNQTTDQESISTFSQGDSSNVRSEITSNVSNVQETSKQVSSQTDLVSAIDNSVIQDSSEDNKSSVVNLDHESNVASFDNQSPMQSIQQSNVSDHEIHSFAGSSKTSNLTGTPDQSAHSILDDHTSILSPKTSETSHFGQSEIASHKSGTSHMVDESPLVSEKQSFENAFIDQSHGSSHHSDISIHEDEKDHLEASPIMKSTMQDIDNESIQSAHFDTNTSISDEDPIDEAIDEISSKDKDLNEELAKLDQMSNVGELEQSAQSDSQSVKSQHANVIQNLEAQEVDKSSQSEPEVFVQNNIQQTGEDINTQQKSNKIIESLESKANETPDDFDKPLTENDKRTILEELEGKDVNLHINHKSIESLHHLNVYHYMPPKFISEQSMGYLYPGMVPQQPQQMTPGPIINIHNSTSSASGSGSNSGSSGNNQAVVNTALPSQNWGQVVYSNHNHSSGGVNTNASSQSVTPTTIQLDSPSAKVDSSENKEEQVNNVIPQQVVSDNANLAPNVITTPNSTPEIINNPKIEMGKEIKVDPVINQTIENESADSVSYDNSSKSSDSLHSDESDGTEEHVSHKETVSFHNGDIDPHKADLTDDAHLLINPSELSDFDEETVHVDPHKVNKREGQSVILGGDDSPKNLDNQSKFHIL